MGILFLRGVYGEVCKRKDSDVSGFLFCVFIIMTELDKLMAISATTFEFRFYSELCGRRIIEHLFTTSCWYIYKEVQRREKSSAFCDCSLCF
jgi:hypothetical protein